MGAAGRRQLALVTEQEAGVEDAKRVDGRERAKGGGDRARLGELAGGSNRVDRAEQHRRPPSRCDEPVLEQLSDSGCPILGGVQEREQRAALGGRAKSNVESAAE